MTRFSSLKLDAERLAKQHGHCLGAWLDVCDGASASCVHCPAEIDITAAGITGLATSLNCTRDASPDAQPIATGETPSHHHQQTAHIRGTRVRLFGARLDVNAIRWQGRRER